MTEYIDRDAFLEQKREQYCKGCARRKGIRNGKYKTLYEIGEAPCRACGIDDVLNDVEDFPAADVRPVVRGKWVTPTVISGRAFNIPHCSACDGVPCGVDEHTNFCPNCGADMRQCPEDEAAEEMASVRWWLRREES